jgi:DNA polymerase sigma
VWKNNNKPNTLASGILWIEFLRYYTEIFDYEKNVVTIRQVEPLRRSEKGWFPQIIAIEDPFILTHNLADKLSLRSQFIIQIKTNCFFSLFNRIYTNSARIYSS